MKKKIIHIIQNSHTDLGYTHRQEYVYRAHAKYIDYAVECIKENSKFKWTLENFWMVENYKKSSSESQYLEFLKYIKSGNIEVTANYLNLLNIFDLGSYETKVKKLKKEFPDVRIAIQQDVNSFSKDQAIILKDNGIDYLYASIHTHHGMFVGKGKQRGFKWDLDNGKSIYVWVGEHYMLGNELGLHLEEPNKYTFKDDIEKYEKSDFDKGLKRLKKYIDLLESEGYEYSHIPIVMSGTVIDNSPPNLKILEGIEKMKNALGKNIEIKISTLKEFFNSIEKEKFPTFTGEWPSWWVDGVISTPEAVRQYREAQVIYKNIKVWKDNNKDKNLNEETLKELEECLLLFSEHTWGSWSSQSDPFSNGNNLLLYRKISMATQASMKAWTLWDQIKEKEGYNIVKVNETNKIFVKNIHNKKLEKTIFVDIPRNLRNISTNDRYVNYEDAIEINDKNGKIIESAVSINMGLNDNLNSSIETDKNIMIKLSLNPFEEKELFINKKNISYSIRTSSYHPIGVDNQNDIYYNEKFICKYLRDGIENNFYILKWNENGIYEIYDKNAKTNILKNNSTIAPIHIISKGDSRTTFGRNRQGPSAKKHYAKVISHKKLLDKNNIQIVKLVFQMSGSKKTELNIRMSSISNKIRFQLILHKKGYVDAENVYLNIPFKNKSIDINQGKRFFKAGIEQLPKTNLDYYKVTSGVVFKNSNYEVGIYLQDMPLLQVGNLSYTQRHIMGESNNNKLKRNPSIWIMSNYWETNYKGTLEGSYSFSFDVSSSENERSSIIDDYKNFIAFNVWK